MIDTHSHIYEPEFDEDRDEVIQRARNAGVERILLPNINEESIPRMLALAEKYPDYCFPMMGLHPEDVKEDYQQVLDRMEKLLFPQTESVTNQQFIPNTPYIAIGEIGLDFYWDDTYRKEQLEAFERQICWARDLNLPIVIHSRKAEPELIDAMDRHKNEGLRGIFHCFSGSKETALRLLKHEGFCLGIGGVLTFKKSHLPETLSHIPLERIVMETDSPYLAPVPHRGKRNESAFVVSVCEKLAEVYNVTPEIVSKTTNSSTKSIFHAL